jgi:hypothetical protein
MNAAMINRIVSLIPERTARTLSGAVLVYPDAAACRYPERLAHLVQFLSWMSPLNPITKDDQRVLGLLNAAGRPVHAADMEAEDETQELDDEPQEQDDELQAQEDEMPEHGEFSESAELPEETALV